MQQCGTGRGEQRRQAVGSRAVGWLLRAGLALALVACSDDARTLSSQVDYLKNVGSDYTTGAVLGSDGSLIFGVNGAGVGATERQDPTTGRILYGAHGTSTAGTLVALSPDGKQRWSKTFPAAVSPPVVGNDGTIYVSSDDVLYALSPAGKQRWQRGVPGGLLSLGGDGGVLVGSSSGLVAIGSDGEGKGDVLADPLLAGRGVLVPSIATGDGEIVTVTAVEPGGSSESGRWLTALDLSGAMRWHVELAAWPPLGGLLRDGEGQIWVVYREEPKTEVYSRDGALVRTIPNIKVTAISDALIVGIRRDNDGNPGASYAVVGLGPDGTERWRSPIGRSHSMPILTSDGHVQFAQDTRRNDLDSGETVVHTLRADGSLAHQYRVAMNGFSGPIVATSGGMLLLTGMWANQYPPFQALVAGMWSEAKGLAKGPWPRNAGGDNRGSYFAGPVVKGLPSATQLRGWWRGDGAAWRMLWIGRPQSDWPEIAASQTSYGVWSASALGVATLVERGTLEIQAQQVTLQPTWQAEGSSGDQSLAARTLPLAAGDPWHLHLPDPLASAAATKARSWTRAYALAVPPPVFGDAGHLQWHTEFGGRVEENATALALGAKAGQMFLAGVYSGEGTAFDDPGSNGACCDGVSAFYSSLDVADIDQAWAQYDVASSGFAGRPVRAATTSSGAVLVLATPTGNATIDKLGFVYSLRRFGASNAPPKRTDIQATGSFLGSAVDMGVMPDGGALVVGSLAQSATLGGQTLSVEGATDTIWLARSDASDALLWAKTVANAGAAARPQHMVVDGKGEALIVGTSIKIGGTPPTATDALTLWKRDANGEALWQRSFGGALAYGSLSVDVTLGPAGEVALFGSFGGTLQLASANLATADAGRDNRGGSAPDIDGFVALLTADGGVRWLRGFGGPKAQNVTAAAFDKHGVLHVGGILGIELGAAGPTGIAISQPVFAGFSPCGERLWTREVQSCTNCAYNWLLPVAMARDANGDIVAAATVAGWVRLDEQLLPSPKTGDQAGTPSNLSLQRWAGLDDAGAKILAAQGDCATLPPLPHRVSVTISGSGGGRVVSSPAGIDCPGSCSADFAVTQAVTLTATANANAAFVGWEGACSGLAACTIAAGESATVTARFERPVVSAFEVLGGASGDEAIAMLAPDADGTSFLAQIATGAMGNDGLDYGAGVVTGLGATDALVGRRTLAGATAWTLVVGGPGLDTGAGISGDGAGGLIAGVVITGGQAQVGAQAVASDGDANVLLARIDGAGKPLWAKYLAIDGGNHDTRLVGNGKGAVVVLGRVPSATTLHGVEIAGPYAMMVSADGVVGWVRALPALQVVSADVGPQGWTALAYRRTDLPQVEILVLDDNGKDVWMTTTKAFPGPSALVLGADGGLVTLGMFGGAVDFAPTLEAVPTWAKFSVSGALLQAKPLAQAPVAVAMSRQAATALGDGGVCYLSEGGGAAVTLDAAGTVVWSLPLPEGAAVVAVPGGPIWLGGGLSGAAQVGGLSVSVAADHHRDAWLARVLP